MREHAKETICSILVAVAILGVAYGMVSLYQDGLRREKHLQDLDAKEKIQDQWLERLQIQVSEEKKERKQCDEEKDGVSDGR